MLGSGFKSNTTLKIVGTTRELGCILNDDSDQGKTIRSRFQAMADRNWTEEPSNFAKEFTETMDAMGIVDSFEHQSNWELWNTLEGKRYILENTILRYCAKASKAPKPISTKGYKPITETPYPSEGSPRLLGYKSHTNLHRTIIKIPAAITRSILEGDEECEENMDPSRFRDENMWKQFLECRCDEKDKSLCLCINHFNILPTEIKTAGESTLHRHAKDAIKQIRHDCETSYEFHQWINPEFNLVKDWKEENQWEKVKAFGCTTILLEDPAIYDMESRNISLGFNSIRNPASCDLFAWRNRHCHLQKMW